MTRLIHVNDENIDYETTLELIEKDWQERLPHKKNNYQFMSSPAFMETVRNIRRMREELTFQLIEKKENGQHLDEVDMEFIKMLETLCFRADSIPGSKRREEGEKLLEENKSPYTEKPFLTVRPTKIATRDPEDAPAESEENLKEN